MSPNYTLIRDQIEKESWLLNNNLPSLLNTISTLPNCFISAQAHGICIGTTASFPQFLTSGNNINLFEHGISLQSPPYRTHLHPGTKYHRDLCIGLDFNKNQESLELAFNIETNTHAIIQNIAAATSSTIPTSNLLESINNLIENPCPCCIDKRKALRTEPEIHPLYGILTHLPHQKQPINIQLNGTQISTNMSFTPTSQDHHQGIVYLQSENHHLSIDLTSIYSLRLEITEHARTPATALHLHNSLGNHIASITTKSTAAYAIWHRIVGTTPRTV